MGFSLDSIVINSWNQFLPYLAVDDDDDEEIWVFEYEPFREKSHWRNIHSGNRRMIGESELLPIDRVFDYDNKEDREFVYQMIAIEFNL